MYLLISRRWLECFCYSLSGGFRLLGYRVSMKNAPGALEGSIPRVLSVQAQFLEHGAYMRTWRATAVTRRIVAWSRLRGNPTHPLILPRKRGYLTHFNNSVSYFVGCNTRMIWRVDSAGESHHHQLNKVRCYHTRGLLFYTAVISFCTRVEDKGQFYRDFQT